MPKELSGHDQENSWKEDNVFAFINTLMVNTSITLSLRPILVAIDANENHKAGEEL
jgi:hypothetical protein